MSAPPGEGGNDKKKKEKKGKKKEGLTLENSVVRMRVEDTFQKTYPP